MVSTDTSEVIGPVRRRRDEGAGDGDVATVCPVSIVGWIVVGLLAGAIARWVVRDDRSGCVYTMVVGVLGAPSLAARTLRP